MNFGAESNLPQTGRRLSGCFDLSKRVQAGMAIRALIQRTRIHCRCDRGPVAVRALLIAAAICAQATASELLHSNDVICFLGGANVVSAQEYGYLETILRMRLPTLNLRFRSLAHEG